MSPLFLSSCNLIAPTCEKLNNKGTWESAILLLIFATWVIATGITIFVSLGGMLGGYEPEHYEIENRKIYHREGYSVDGGLSEFWPSFEFGAHLCFGIWFGLSSLLLLMYYVWYPVFGMSDYNMLIKTVSFIIMFVGYVWIYNKYILFKWFSFFTVLGVISSIILIGDIAISLWNIQ